MKKAGNETQLYSFCSTWSNFDEQFSIPSQEGTYNVATAPASCIPPKPKSLVISELSEGSLKTLRGITGR